MIRKIAYIILTVSVLYVLICVLFYFNQEMFGFRPEKLPIKHKYISKAPIKELSVQTRDGIILNGVLAKAESSRGLILFLHGSGGNIDKYMVDIPVYTNLGYDIYYLDYRGYGKSEGSMINEQQFKNDLDDVYSFLTKTYMPEEIVIIGFSMGTFAASYLASKYNPRFLILESGPYWILEQFIDRFFFIPVELLSKYSFKTYEYVRDTDIPVVIFLGSRDHLSDETRWSSVLKPGDKLIIIDDAGHQNFAGKRRYMEEMESLLQ